MSMAALSLAAKVCEIPLKLSDVVNTCYRSGVGFILATIIVSIQCTAIFHILLTV